MNNLSIIIPIHEFNENVSKYLSLALNSIKLQKNIEKFPQILIIYPPEIENDIKSFDVNGLTIDFIKNDGKTDYQSQVNHCMDFVNNEYFSVLEFDDEYSLNFLNNVKIYLTAYTNIDIMMTLLIEVDENNNGLKYTNEVVWAQQFIGENGEMGYLSPDILKQYTDFKLSGAVIKKSEFVNIGKYKTNIEFSFMYELLLRALSNGCKIFTLPKICYKHLANRENSLSMTYIKNMSMNERKFWFETAQKESNFINDRIIDKSLMKK